MAKKINLIGQQFGALTVLEKTNRQSSDGSYYWKCICNKCGNIKEIVSTNLKKIKTCGCEKTPKLIGQKFGKLIVVKFIGKQKNQQIWLCECECNGSIIASTGNLNAGRIKSCGKCPKITKNKNKIILPENLVSLSVASKKYNIHVETLRRYIKKGYLVNYSTNKYAIVDTNEIQKFIDIKLEHRKKRLSKSIKEIRFYNKEFFKTENEISSYWAGFLIADGNIYDNRLQISISKKDLNHLENFCDDIQLNKKYIKCRIIDNKYDVCYLSLRNKQYPIIFKKWGIIPDKTHNFIPPVLENKNYIKHLIRGWFDGDGYFGFNLNKYPRLSITGSIDSLEWLSQQLRNLGFIKIRCVGKKIGRHWCSLYINGVKNLKLFYDLFNGKRRLERKWSKIESCLEYYNLLENKNANC